MLKAGLLDGSAVDDLLEAVDTDLLADVELDEDADGTDEGVVEVGGVESGLGTAVPSGMGGRDAAAGLWRTGGCAGSFMGSFGGGIGCSTWNTPP